MRRTVAILGGIGLLALPVLVGTAGPAGADEVDTAAELRVAWDDPTVTVIDVLADITFTGCADATDHPTRPSDGAALTVNGNGHTVTQTCADNVFDSEATTAIAIHDLTVVGGDEDAMQIDGDLLLDGVTVRDAGSDGVDLEEVSNLTANGSSFLDNGDDGINTEADGAVTCDGCVITGNGDDGIDADSGGTAVHVARSMIANNTDDGIDVGDTVEFVEVQRSAVTGNGGNGIETILAAVTVIESDISGNGAGDDDDGDAGIDVTDEDVTVIRSTVSGNSGDGVVAPDGDITIVNSTVAGNGGDGADAGAALSLAYVTMADNGADNAEGETVEAFGSVLVRSGAEDANCDGDVTSHGYNFADDTSCGFTTEPGDTEGAGLEPGLGALALNGGFSPTMLPSATSPLVDAIPSSACQTGPASGLTTDQRVLDRPEVAGGSCDIGAVEVQAEVVEEEPRTPEQPPAAQPVTAQPSFTG